MSVLESIGRTPMAKLDKVNAKNPSVRILAKLEGTNPGGSVKDRPALYMIREAVRTGALIPGKTILEPTSGNTGIALAMIGAAMGYPVTLCMPECVTVERRRVLEAYGAEVILTPAAEKTDGAIRIAHEMVQLQPDRYFMPNQFANPANPQAHYETTGPEILEQTGGRIDVFVAGMGTGGTLMGVSRFLRDHVPTARVIGIEPSTGSSIQGLKNMTESIVPEIFDPERIDEKINIGNDEAFAMSRRLATQEGIFVGMSSGAAVAGALHVAERLESGTIVVLLPDRGDRYLSTTLFRSICAECPP